MANESKREIRESCFPAYEDGKWGYVDKSGSVVIEPQFDEAAWYFSEGLTCVKLGRKYGYVDQTGKLIIEPQFDDVQAFSGGMAPVQIGDKYGYVDKEGKCMWDSTE